MSGSRTRGGVRMHVGVQLAAALVVVAAVNFLAFEFPARADFSRSQKFALAGQTKRAVRALETPLEITVFFSRTTMSPVSALYGDVTALLDELVFSGREKIRVEYVDPVRDLSRAREVQAKYKFRADENVLILDYAGRVDFLPVAQMADFDLGALAAGGSARVTAFRGEEAITSAIIGLTNPDRQKVYLLQGHGEPAPGANSPVGTLLGYLGRQNAEVHPLRLADVDAVPADCATLMVIGPQTDLEEREADLLSAYWSGGGRMLILLDPAAKTQRLDNLLTSVGIRPRGDRVLRTVQLGFATGILREVTAEFWPDSPVTRRLAGLTLFLPGATQSLAIRPDAPDGLVLQPLLQPAEPFWGEADHVTDETKGVAYNEGRDAGHPFFVGASAAQGGAGDERVRVEAGKLVAVGNAEFALDAAISQSGLDFLVSASHWLLDRGQLADIAPKPRRYFPLNMGEDRMAMLSGLALIALPGLAALLATLQWWRRRT